ncbi:MAG: 3'-5' exonuclease [Bdellovibrionales bacterium]|nr:3'-5' exonuclease [Bdellovibrionales bacterium]
MRYVAFDLETTGFLPGMDQITEIGAVRFVDGEPTEAFATLVNPGRDIPRGAQDVTGITNEMVQDKPKIDTLLESFAEFCGNDILVAHNAPFDFQFLTADIKKFESPAPKGLILDSCTISRKVFPGLLNYKLGTLVQHLNIPSGGFHRAQEDATYCGYLFGHILHKLTQNGNVVQVESLVQLSAKAPLTFPQIVRQPKQLDLLSL